MSKPSARTSSYGSRASYGLPFLHGTQFWNVYSCRAAASAELENADTVKKKDSSVSLSACRLSYPSVNGKIFTRFVDGLSFEFVLSNPRRTPVLSFKCSSWIFSLTIWPHDLALRQYALRARKSFVQVCHIEIRNFLRPTLLKLHISAQLIESFPTP